MPAAEFRLTRLPCLDSPEIALGNKRDLAIDRERAAELGRSAVEAAERGYYVTRGGRNVDWREQVALAVSAKRSIPPDAPLPASRRARHSETRVQVSNETTLSASRRLAAAGLNPAALNFANGIHPGGGFLHGARAQEETLCRSSALYSTLVGDELYAYHRGRPRPDSSDWVIYSPQVPVFRTDDGAELDEP